MLKVIIIDNELEAIRTLKTQLEKYCSHLVSVVAFCQDSEEAIPLILELHADLIFLETEMSPFDGFELLDRVKDIPFEVIFITNFDEHAVRAYNHSAIDYLLKPVKPADLRQAVERCQQKISGKEYQRHLEGMLSGNGKSLASDSTIVLHTEEGLTILKVGDILFLRAQGAYTLFYLKNNDRVMVSKTLKEWEKTLGEYRFFRIHYSTLVNLDHVKSYLKEEGGKVILSIGVKLNVARRRREKLVAVLAGRD